MQWSERRDFVHAVERVLFFFVAMLDDDRFSCCTSVYDTMCYHVNLVFASNTEHGLARDVVENVLKYVFVRRALVQFARFFLVQCCSVPSSAVLVLVRRRLVALNV